MTLDSIRNSCDVFIHCCILLLPAHLIVCASQEKAAKFAKVFGAKSFLFSAVQLPDFLIKLLQLSNAKEKAKWASLFRANDHGMQQ